MEGAGAGTGGEEDITLAVDIMHRISREGRGLDYARASILLACFRCLAGRAEDAAPCITEAVSVVRQLVVDRQNESSLCFRTYWTCVMVERYEFPDSVLTALI